MSTLLPHTLCSLSEAEAAEITQAYDHLPPQDVLRWALATFVTDRIAICTSFQIDGMVILDMALRVDPRVRVFTIDTGRLPQETHALMDQVRRHYGIDVEVYLPEAPDVELLTVTYGPNPFYQSVPLRMACCDARKVRPLRRALRGLDAWVTGLRRDQAATRATIHKVEVDAANGGIVKINPLADWTEDAVWDYARRMDVPSHALYEQGYRSIGCAPCTRPVQTGEEARAGRWWWESDGTAKECGLHLRVRSSDVAVRV